MVHQQLITGKRMNGKVYNFMDIKRKKPFFKKPIKITIGNPINESYYMVKNFVYNEKQILALKTEQDSSTIVLVEAKIENGQLTHVSMLSDEFLCGVSNMFEGILNAL